MNMKEMADAIIQVGQLVFRFGRTDRLTVHEDGVTPESDTDHTVMLGVIACAYAKEAAPELDVGLIAQFSLIHDLVEAYAGDTVTLGMDAAALASKKEREAAAFERIRREFGARLPWIPETIEAYESLATPEARFVKTLDKGMPSISHFLNKAAVLTREGYTRDSLEVVRTKERDLSTHTYAADQPQAMALRDVLMDLVYETFYPER